jgi:hypothetical protein
MLDNISKSSLNHHIDRMQTDRPPELQKKIETIWQMDLETEDKLLKRF